MTLSANTVFEVRNVADYANASDTNGGGFVTGASGTDYSYASIPAAGGPQYSVTDAVTNGSTTITSATAAFGTDVVGNIGCVEGGTGSVVRNWFQVISRTSATAIVVDRATGLTAGTGVTLKIGGALATIGGLGAALAAAPGANNMRAWQKYSASSYAIALSTSNVPTGIFTFPTGHFVFEGYDITRGDRTGNRPLNLWTASAPGALTYGIIVGGSSKTRVANVIVEGGSINNCGGFNLSGRSLGIQCIARNCNGTAAIGFTLGANNVAHSCSADTCTTGFSAGTVISCTATACTTGFLNSTVAVNCLAYSNTANGFSFSGTTNYVNRCTADSNTTAGFNCVASDTASLVNCVASNHSGGGGIGFNISVSAVTLDNCASYNNTTEVSGAPLISEGMILNASFSGQPYVAAGSDFRPNDTAGAGMLLRAAGIGVYGQTDNCDIGAVQHSDPAGGGGGGISLAGPGGLAA